MLFSGCRATQVAKARAPGEWDKDVVSDKATAVSIGDQYFA